MSATQVLHLQTVFSKKIEASIVLVVVDTQKLLNPKVHTPLFATVANPLQLYHSPRAEILAFNFGAGVAFEPFLHMGVAVS